MQFSLCNSLSIPLPFPYLAFTILLLCFTVPLLCFTILHPLSISSSISILPSRFSIHLLSTLPLSPILPPFIFYPSSIYLLFVLHISPLDSVPMQLGSPSVKVPMQLRCSSVPNPYATRISLCPSPDATQMSLCPNLYATQMSLFSQSLYNP